MEGLSPSNILALDFILEWGVYDIEIHYLDTHLDVPNYNITVYVEED